MAVVLHDLAADGHWPQHNRRLLLLGDRHRRSRCSRREERKRLVAQGLDRPQRLSTSESERGAKGVSLGELGQRGDRHGKAPSVRTNSPISRSGFGVFDHVGQQSFRQFGGIVLGCRFERMEERRNGCGSTGFLKGGDGGGLADARHPREPFESCGGNASRWRRSQIERPHRIEPIEMAVEQPASVGVDRLLNALGAFATLKQACIVIDCGTATTVDFVDGEGTLITYGGERMEAPLVSGIAFNRNEASLTILGVPDRPTVAAQILNPISDANIDVDMIVQNTMGDGTADFTFTVNRDDYRRARALLEETATLLGAACVQGNGEIAKVSIVGVGMWNHPGVARTMFKVLGEEGINMQLISTSEIKISVVIDEKYLELAVRSLHSAFGLDNEPHEQPLGNNP